MLDVKSLEDFVGSVTIVHEVVKNPQAKTAKANNAILLVAPMIHPLSVQHIAGV